MTPDLKQKITLGLYGLGALIIVFFLGFIEGKSLKPSVTTSAKTDIQQDKDTHTQTKTVTVKEPDGKVETTTTTDTVITAKTTETKDVQTTVTPQKSKINVSAMAGYDFFHPSLQPTYGLSVSKELLGPITVGAFGLTNGTLGVTVGINF